MIPPEALNAAVNAYYKAKLEQAALTIMSIPYDGSELPEIIGRLKNESDTARVLVLASLIEDKVESLISKNMYDLDTSSARERIFAGNGPLSTFGNRITICYHLGWISKKTFIRINCIRKIRNEFAHNAYKVNFESQSVKKYFPEILETIDLFESKVFPIIKVPESNSNLRRPSDLTVGDQFLLAATLCVGNLMQELITYPTSKREQINPSDFQRILGRSPDNVTNTIRNMLLAVLRILDTDQQ